MHSWRDPVANPIVESRLFYVVCQSRRRNSGLLVPMDRRPGSGMGGSDVARAVDVAGTLFLLITTQPAPEPKKYQDEKDGTAGSTADDRPWRI